MYRGNNIFFDGRDEPLFTIAGNVFTFTGVDNERLAHEILEQQKRLSLDVNSCLYEDTVFIPGPASEGARFIETITNLFNDSGLFMTEFWTQIHQPLESSSLHHHGENDLAFVYYVKVPRGAGNIVFELEKMVYHVEPKEGEMLIFPAWLKHKVTKNLSTDIRISLAGNLKYKK